MPNKKNETAPYTPVTQERELRISFWKALSILGGAILVAIVGTAFTIGSILNTDHFVLANTVEDVKENRENIKSIKGDVQTILIQQATMIQQLDSLNNK